MESVAPPGGDHAQWIYRTLGRGRRAADGEPEMVHIKGAMKLCPPRRLLGMGAPHRAVGRVEVGSGGSAVGNVNRRGLLERAIAHHGGCSAWWAKQVSERPVWCVTFTATAAARGVEVFGNSLRVARQQYPVHMVARFLRAITGVGDLDGDTARSRVRAPTSWGGCARPAVAR